MNLRDLDTKGTTVRFLSCQSYWTRENLTFESRKGILMIQFLTLSLSTLLDTFESLSIKWFEMSFLTQIQKYKREKPTLDTLSVKRRDLESIY